MGCSDVVVLPTLERRAYERRDARWPRCKQRFDAPRIELVAGAVVTLDAAVEIRPIDCDQGVDT